MQGIIKKNQRGATLVEYVLLAALISIVAVVAIRSIGQNVQTTFSTVDSTLD